MAILIPSVGEVIALKNILNNTAPQDWVLKLFTNNITPAEGDVAGSYTEATGFGYAAKTLSGASWSFTTGDPSFASYAQQTWTFTGALGNVYGWFAVGASDGILRAAERFASAPVNIALNGDTIRITPRIELA